MIDFSIYFLKSYSHTKVEGQACANTILCLIYQIETD